jgi:hypothetical protein
MNLNRMYLQCIHEFHHICVIYQCTTAFMLQLNILGTCIHVKGFSNASNFFSTESVDPVPKHKHLSKTSIHFHVIKRGSK